MALKITNIRLNIELDANEDVAAIKVSAYRVEDDTNPGVRASGGSLALDVAGLNKTAHNAGTAGELIEDLIIAAKAAEGL